MHPPHRRLGRTLRNETLEDRRVLSVTLGDLSNAGISQRTIDHIDTNPYEAQILSEETLANTLAGLNQTQVAPANAQLITSEARFSSIQSGGVYLIQGDLTVTGTFEVPSNVTIYVDGSIFKQGVFTAPGGVHSTENGTDSIFRLSGSDNVQLIGVNNALLHGNPNLNANAPNTTAIYIHENADNIEIDGFEIANVWEGVVARSLAIDNVTVTNNYIHDTAKRAVWSLGATNFRATHNFVENAGVDSFDWDAFTMSAVGYENVSIGAGRWAGFVEEGAQDSAFIRGLALMVDFGNPNRGYPLGWADNGSSPNFVSNQPDPAKWTQHNYFIDNVVFEPPSFNTGGGDYFAKYNAGKGPTYFWANRGFDAGQSTDNFDDAEWLDSVPTAGGRNDSINGVQWLEDLAGEFNATTDLVLSVPAISVFEFAPVGTAIGTVVVTNADVNDVTFSITGGNEGGAFAIDDNGVITLVAPLDYGVQPSYALTVSAADGDLSGSIGVSIAVESPFRIVNPLFEHGFTSSDFTDAADARGQQGWTGQNGWAIEDASGAGYLTSSTTAYQGVSNNLPGEIAVGEAISLNLEVDLDLIDDSNADQFRFGVTTLDGSGSFVPALGNNGGSILSGKLRYVAADDSIEFYANEGSSQSLKLSSADLGLDRPLGDGQTDQIQIQWEATKTDTVGEWSLKLIVRNLGTGQTLGELTDTVVEATTYATSTGLFAGLRGLANSTQSTFRFDRIVYSTVTPGSATPGDYNFDGVVDTADYTVWRDEEGQSGTHLAADPNQDGSVDQADYDTWRDNYGTVGEAPTLATATAPILFLQEPAPVAIKIVSPDTSGPAPAPTTVFEPLESNATLLAANGRGTAFSEATLLLYSPQNSLEEGERSLPGGLAGETLEEALLN